MYQRNIIILKCKNMKKLKTKKVIRKKTLKTKKPAKKIVKKITKPLKKVGKITHYFSEIKVAVIKLSAPLKIGEKIKVVGGECTDFKQSVKSIQIDHKKVRLAKKGKSIGIKIGEKVREGYSVYKL
jgi:putative protease